MLNLFSFVWVLIRMVIDVQINVLEALALHIVLCDLIVLINLPVYQGLFFREDNGKMFTSVAYRAANEPIQALVCLGLFIKILTSSSSSWIKI